MAEVWKPVVGFDDYEVSDLGRVRSWKHRTPGKRRDTAKLVRPSRGDRYCRVVLRRDGRSETRLVHRLVLEAFVGPCPDGMECLHDNGIHSDNALTNLLWGTPKANMDDQRRHGVIRHAGTHNGSAKLDEERVRGIRTAAGSNLEVARRYGVSATTVSNVRNRRLWAHVA